MKKTFWLLLVFPLLFSCSRGKEEKVAENTGPKQAMAGLVTKNIQAPVKATVDPSKKYFATIQTSKGVIKVELFASEAPLSVTNFMQLAQKGFYKNLTFHRVVRDFVIQGGDPTGTGRGGPGYTIPAEIKRTHTEGALAWARLPDMGPDGNPVNPKKESSGSQFYITLASQPSLDGEYTVFGQTVEGMAVVKQIVQGDKIQDVAVEMQ